MRETPRNRAPRRVGGVSLNFFVTLSKVQASTDAECTNTRYAGRDGVVSETVELLQAGRNLAWLGLVPAFDHAILLAQEAEYVALQATRAGELPQSNHRNLWMGLGAVT